MSKKLLALLTLIAALSLLLTGCAYGLVPNPPAVEMTRSASVRETANPSTATVTPVNTPTPTSTPDPNKVVRTYASVPVNLAPGMSILTLVNRNTGQEYQAGGPYTVCGVTEDHMLVGCGEGNAPNFDAVFKPAYVVLDGTGIVP